jgi:hypothetical protein
VHCSLTGCEIQLCNYDLYSIQQVSVCKGNCNWAFETIKRTKGSHWKFLRTCPWSLINSRQPATQPSAQCRSAQPSSQQPAAKAQGPPSACLCRSLVASKSKPHSPSLAAHYILTKHIHQQPTEAQLFHKLIGSAGCYPLPFVDLVCLQAASS